MLTGEYHHILDSKNRVIIPSAFRQVFNQEKNSCVITRGLDKSLFFYPFSEWQILGNKLKNISINRADVRAFLRILFSGAHPVDLDNQGRVIIPPPLKEFASIKDKVVIIGVINKIEIWDEDLWSEYYQQKRNRYEQIAETIMELEI